MLKSDKAIFVVIISTSIFLTFCQGRSSNKKDTDKFDSDGDADIDADTDTDTDTDTDMYVDRGAPVVSWAGCPTAEEFPNDPEGSFLVEVRDPAVYCATFFEDGSLKEQLERKALLRVAPGSYTLPDGGGNNLGLPFCLRLGEDAEPIKVGMGQATYEKSRGGDDMILHNYWLVQQVASPPGGELKAYFSPLLPPGETARVVLGGAPDLYLYLAFMDAASIAVEQECEEEICVWPQDFEFDSCSHASSSLNRHEVKLETGAVTFDVRIGESMAGTEPGAFVRAAGEFSGQGFEQDNYFKLVYAPSHHHFVRDFAVLFDTPIDGVCGVEVTGLEGLDLYSSDVEELFDDVADQAFAVDCELNHLEELSVQEHTVTVDP